MTTSTPNRTAVKFTALSPLLTQLVRARTELQQREGKLKVGRTVLTYFGSPEELDRLIDFLIMDEIPGAGANSRDVKRLRELRRYLRAATSTVTSDEQRDDAAHVTISQADDIRDRVLDLLDVLWERHADTPAGMELTALADASRPDGTVDYRAWLSEVL